VAHTIRGKGKPWVEKKGGREYSDLKGNLKEVETNFQNSGVRKPAKVKLEKGKSLTKPADIKIWTTLEEEDTSEVYKVDKKKKKKNKVFFFFWGHPHPAI